MKRVQGAADVKLMECVNPAKGKWRMRWDVQSMDNGMANYMEAEFLGKPTYEQIKNTVIGWYNERIEADILRGFSYEGAMVWLSPENQFNYKAAYDLAVQTEGNSLPVVFKFGNEDNPVYKTFATLEELADFYTRAIHHIQITLQRGWKDKDSFIIDDYCAG